MDFSTLSKLLTCPRQFQHSHIDKKTGDRDVKSLNFGKAWHKVIEEHGRRNTQEHHPGLVNDVLNKLQWQDPADDYRTADKLTLGYDRWFHQLGKNYKWVKLEHPFEVQYKHDGVNYPERYTGRWDFAVLTNVQQGQGEELWLGDAKTSSRLDSDWTMQYRLSDQFKWYFNEARIEFPNLAGFLVDVFHVTKGNKSGKSEGEKEGVRFYQLPMRFPEAALQEAQRNMYEAMHLAEYYKKRQYYPKNTSACRMYNRLCDFADICDTFDPELRQQLLNALPDNTFNPLAE